MRKEPLHSGRTANAEFVQSTAERARREPQLFRASAGPFNSPIEQGERLKDVATLFVLQRSSRA